MALRIVAGKWNKVRAGEKTRCIQIMSIHKIWNSGNQLTKRQIIIKKYFSNYF